MTTISLIFACALMYAGAARSDGSMIVGSAMYMLAYQIGKFTEAYKSSHNNVNHKV